MNELVFIGLMTFLVVMSILGFAMMWIDKKKAIGHRRRISENTLMLVAAFGGAAGSWLGMEIFRHKTKHLKFIVGVPVLLLFQVAAILFLNGKYHFLP